MVVANASYIPQKGDVVWISLDPQMGHEQAGRRPALVLSPWSYNRNSGLAVICPITNRSKGYPFEMPLPDGLAATGVVLADQVKSLDWKARNAVYIDSVSGEYISSLFHLLAKLLREMP